MEFLFMEAFGGGSRKFYGPTVSYLKAVGKRSLEWDLNDWKWDGDLFTAGLSLSSLSLSFTSLDLGILEGLGFERESEESEGESWEVRWVAGRGGFSGFLVWGDHGDGSAFGFFYFFIFF